MHIIRFTTSDSSRAKVGVMRGDSVSALPVANMGTLLAMSLADFRTFVEHAGEPFDGPVQICPPVDGATEVWASGVTYLRSRQGRTEESASPSIYELIYEADRPELFFKSVAWRVVGPGQPIGIREDSPLNVPEPELAVVVNARGETVGYTICNDVSSRTLEGANPLYLPQAKLFAGSCALGPSIRPAWEIPEPRDLTITMDIVRGGESMWRASTDVGQMRRRVDDLVQFLVRPDHFPQGAVLSTGTGLVPGMEVSLEAGDLVTITIDEIGVLSNEVVAGKSAFASLWNERLVERSSVEQVHDGTIGESA